MQNLYHRGDLFQLLYLDPDLLTNPELSNNLRSIVCVLWDERISALFSVVWWGQRCPADESSHAATCWSSSVLWLHSSPTLSAQNGRQSWFSSEHTQPHSSAHTQLMWVVVQSRSSCSRCCKSLAVRVESSFQASGKLWLARDKNFWKFSCLIFALFPRK